MAFEFRGYREIAGMTQAQVAEALGKTINTIRSWETGRTAPGADDLSAMCRLYGCDPCEIMGWPTRDGLPVAPPLGEVERGIVEDYAKCDVKWRALIADVARAARSASEAGL